MAAINDPLGAFGETAHKETNVKFSFKASAAISAKAVVAIGTDFQVATLATDGTDSLGIGIADAAIASGNTGKVTVLGLVQDVNADGSISAGDLLKVSATTDGYVLATATPAAGEVVGVAVNDSASDVVDVWISGKALS